MLTAKQVMCTRLGGIDWTGKQRSSGLVRVDRRENHGGEISLGHVTEGTIANALQKL